jgi:hypothetical protein
VGEGKRVEEDIDDVTVSVVVVQCKLRLGRSYKRVREEYRWMVSYVLSISKTAVLYVLQDYGLAASTPNANVMLHHT